MASYENISPLFLAKLFEQQVATEMRKELEKVNKEIIERAIKQAVDLLSIHADLYRTHDHLGEDLRITLVDKRK